MVVDTTIVILGDTGREATRRYLSLQIMTDCYVMSRITKQMTPSDSLTMKTLYLELRIIFLRALVTKLRSTTILSHNGGRHVRIHVMGAHKLTLLTVSQEYDLQCV